jgi:hypothetical protein
MDAEQIRNLEPLLKTYLARFEDCFPHTNTRGHLDVYVRGQLSDLPRKSVEPMALQASVAPRTLQQFLSLFEWDRPLVRALAATGCQGTRLPAQRRHPR